MPLTIEDLSTAFTQAKLNVIFDNWYYPQKKESKIGQKSIKNRQKPNSQTASESKKRKPFLSVKGMALKKEDAMNQI